jgi:glycosyltransferase involved in cell wall biosynthesis
MRVALNAWFWNSPTTGSGQYLRHLVPCLSEIDPSLEIVLVAPGSRAPSGDEVDPGPYRGLPNIPSIRAHAVEESGLLPTNLGKVWFEQIAFPRACSELAADVAHVPYWAPPFRPAVPTVVTIHDLIPLLLPEYRGRLLVRLYTALVSRTAHRADLVLTDSEAARQDIATRAFRPSPQPAMPRSANATACRSVTCSTWAASTCARTSRRCFAHGSRQARPSEPSFPW